MSRAATRSARKLESGLLANIPFANIPFGDITFA